jgi:hypothetical protein
VVDIGESFVGGDPSGRDLLPHVEPAIFGGSKSDLERNFAPTEGGILKKIQRISVDNKPTIVRRAIKCKPMFSTKSRVPVNERPVD